MDKIEFQAEMDAIHQAFGEKAYTKPRLDAIYSACRRLTREEFRYVVESLIADQRYAPLPVDFANAARPTLDKHDAAWKNETERDLQGYERCRWCNLTGKLSAWPRNQVETNLLSMDDIFACPYCPAARRLKIAYPVWHSGRIQSHWPRYSDGVLSDPTDFPEPLKPGEEPAPLRPDEVPSEPPDQPGKVAAIVAKAQMKNIPPAAVQDSFDL